MEAALGFQEHDFNHWQWHLKWFFETSKAPPVKPCLWVSKDNVPLLGSWFASETSSDLFCGCKGKCNGKPAFGEGQRGQNRKCHNFLNLSESCCDVIWRLMWRIMTTYLWSQNSLRSFLCLCCFLAWKVCHMSRAMVGRGEKAPHPYTFNLLRQRPVLLRAGFRPYKGPLAASLQDPCRVYSTT